MIRNLFLFLIVMSCSSRGEKESSLSPKDDVFNENIYKALPSDSLRLQVDRFRKESYIGRPVGEMLLAFNFKKYEVSRFWYSDDSPKKIIGLVFISASNFEFNVLFEIENLLDEEHWSSNDLESGNAYHVRNQKVENYEIRYLGIHQTKPLTLEDIEEKNWVIIRKNI